MDDDRRYHRNTRLILGGAALLMGLLYYLVAWGLRGALEAVESMPLIMLERDVLAPYALFIVVSIAFGWFAAWLAEKRGLDTWPPLAASALIAIGIAVGLSALGIRPWPKTLLLAFGLAAVGFMAAGALRQKLEG